MTQLPERAAFFIDGNNFYHSLHHNKIQNINQINHKHVCQKLAMSRQITYIGYYIGALSSDSPHYGNQRKLFSTLEENGITVVKGRIEKRNQSTDKLNAVDDLYDWFQKNVGDKIPLSLYNIAKEKISKLKKEKVWVEKAVDVHLAIDLVSQAHKNAFDTAYILSADGDYTPAVAFARDLGKRVFGASMNNAYELSNSTNGFIKIPKKFFDDDCFFK
jgi:uncharacterized LabA/DUF88 family protein